MLSIKSYLQKILFIVFSLLFVGKAIAVQCDAIFPSDKTFAVNGSNNFFSFVNGSRCNNQNCRPIPHFLETNLPTLIPSGVFNSNSISAGEYVFSDWGSANTHVFFVGSGTAVIYFDRSIVIPANTNFNVSGLPNNVLIVVNGSLVINGGANINANFYVTGSATVGGVVDITTISGAISVADSLTVYGEGVFDFSPSYTSNMDPHGFCDAAAPLQPIANYHFDECAYTGLAGDVLDQTGNFDARSFSGLDTSNNAKIERSADITSANHHIETSIPINGDFSISTWFKKPAVNSGDRYLVLGAMANGGGDLLYLDRNRNYRWGVYAGGGLTDGTFRFGDLASGWHHLVLTYNANSTTLYIDGQREETVNRRPSGRLKYIGTSYDAINSNSPQGFRSQLDEFMVFDGVLSTTQISEIYTNQQAGNNYDGSNRARVNCSSIVAEYRFDENIYSGASGEITDSIGGFNGQAINVQPISGKVCNAIDLSATGIRDYAILDERILSEKTDFTISLWEKTAKTGAQSFVSGARSGSNNELIFWFTRDTRFSPHLKNSNNGSVSVSSIAGSVWHHLVWTRSGSQSCLYRDKIFQGCRTQSSSALSIQSLILGQEQDRVGGGFVASQAFNGLIDELLVFETALSQAQIAEIYDNQNAGLGYDGSVRTCAAPRLDHFEITHDGQGITCAVEPITIKACADASCSVLSQDNVNVQLSVNGSPKKIVTVSGGTLNTNFSHVTLGNATLSLDQTFECKNGASTSCDVNFSDSGFIFGNDTNSSPAIPTQLSGKPSSIGFNGQNLFIQAVKTNTNTMACAGVFPNGGDIPVNLSYTCAGGNCQNLPLTSNGNAYNLTTTPSAHSLRFTTDSKAYFTLNYPDAAKFSISAQKDIQVTDDQGNSEIKNFSVTSNAFVVRPFGFKLDFSQNSNVADAIAIDANGSKFKKAGENFALRATAVQWVNGEDANNDGIPDDFSALSNNVIANHFANENLAIMRSLVLPRAVDGGVLGALTPVTSNSFVNSVVDNTYAYQEVGIIDLAVSLADGDYLGAGDIQGQVSNVGRFYPDHFTFSNIENGTLQSTCDVGAETAIPYAYSGQRSAIDNNKGSIGFNTLPSVTLSPETSTNAQLKNYFGDLFKLQPSDVTRALLNKDAVKNGKGDVTPIALVANLSDVIFTNHTDNDGSFTLEYTVDDNFYYVHEANAEIAPFAASIYSQINSIEDVDGASAADNDSDNSNGILMLSPDGTGVEVRFGRMAVENSYGPETNNLMQTIKAEYLNTSGQFVTNTNDSCTPFNSTNITLTNKTIAPNGLTGTSSGQLSGGITQSIILKATNVQGAINVEYSAPSWLRYDWLRAGSDGTPKQNPLGVATFGLFRGNDRVIYWREVSN